MSNKQKLKKFTTTKLIGFGLFILFSTVLWFAMTRNYTSVVDASVYGIGITVVGGVFATYVKWYLRKSERENIPRMQVGILREMLDLELMQEVRHINLKRKHKISDEELEEIMNSSFIHDVIENEKMTITNQLDTDENEVSEKTEEITY